MTAVCQTHSVLCLPVQCELLLQVQLLDLHHLPAMMQVDYVELYSMQLQRSR